MLVRAVGLFRTIPTTVTTTSMIGKKANNAFQAMTVAQVPPSAWSYRRTMRTGKERSRRSFSPLLVTSARPSAASAIGAPPMSTLVTEYNTPG